MSSKFIKSTLVQRRRGAPPLPIRDGLNPTRVRVPEEHAGVSTIEFLTAVIDAQRHRDPLDDAAALTERFDNDEVVDPQGNALAPDALLPAGQDVWFYRHPAPEKPIPFGIDIIHEDDRLLVVDKPPFMATMPRGEHIVETATVRLRRQTGIQELSPAHRLDRLTSGLLVFIKRREDRGAYQTLFARREMQKTYEAIAHFKNNLADTSPLVWENRIEKVSGDFQARAVEGEANAVTTLVRVEPLNSDASKAVELRHGPQPQLGRYILEPHTGKTHQLRLHMWLAGAPILGDNAYPVALPAGVENFRTPLELRATGLRFTDPFTQTPREFSL